MSIIDTGDVVLLIIAFGVVLAGAFVDLVVNNVVLGNAFVVSNAVVNVFVEESFNDAKVVNSFCVV